MGSLHEDKVTMAVLGTSMEEREKRTAKETVGTRTGARKQRERQRNRQAEII